MERQSPKIQTGGNWAFHSDATGDVSSTTPQDSTGQSGSVTDVLSQGDTAVSDVAIDLDVPLVLDTGVAAQDGTTEAGCSQPCTSAGDCTTAGASACSLQLCINGCCKSATAPADSPCDDGDACTLQDQCGAAGVCLGTPKVCDDGLPCTTDTCDASTGACQYPPIADHCAIDGVCVKTDEEKPGKPCAVCAPSSATATWSAKPGCCSADADCPATGVCDAPTCTVSTGTCVPGKKLGCCTADTQCDDSNQCTIDTCELATGTCKITPKTCTDASSCQQAACNPTSGACEQTIKAGWCLIGGACVASGASKPGAACEACKPGDQTNAWTLLIGAPCDDGDVCTVNDACTATAGCKGSASQSCCKNHLDCAKLNTNCTTAICDMKAHVCIKSTQKACCEKGACCDPATNKMKASGTLCAGTMTGYNYACSGQKITRRNVYPGCTGLDAKTCSSDSQYAHKGPWTDIKTCPSDTVCSLTSETTMPICKPKVPTGTCKGACGGPAADGTCHCGASCTTLGNCCKDFAATCGCTSGACCDVAKKFLKPQGQSCEAATEFSCSGQVIQKRASTAVCTGTSNTCPVGSWGAWTTVQTCGTGTVCTVAANKSSATCKPVSGSCKGICGKQASSGCWCDSKCTSLGDCCSDFTKTCACGANPQLTCKGTCGAKGAGGCWCDASCVTLGDCCSDKAACCGS